jgi:hypothetical protein
MTQHLGVSLLAQLQQEAVGDPARVADTLSGELNLASAATAPTRRDG